MKSPVNRSSAPLVLRLFDYCFKQGVQDAADTEDDYAVKDWLEQRKQNGDYGLLSEPDTPYDWKRWRFTLYRWCRTIRLNTLGEGYIDHIRGFQKNFSFAVLPISMRFYMMGVEEWLDYPNALNLALFWQAPKTHWKPVPPHLKKMKNSDLIYCIQDFVYERIGKKYPGDMDESRYNDFALAMWRCMQKYPEYGPGNRTEEENL